MWALTLALGIALLIWNHFILRPVRQKITLSNHLQIDVAVLYMFNS